MILGIETSCDETAAALVTEDGRVLSNVVSSQAELHAPYGGVVPEVASRHHLELLLPAVQTALDEADATLDDVQRVAVTQGPGLVGALLVGVSSAKALAWSRRLPLVPVNHLHGHVASLFLAVDGVSDTRHGSGDRSSRRFSACSRVAVTPCCWMCDHSTFEVLGTTLDDAAGEAFDKGARLLGSAIRAALRSTGSRGTAIPRHSRSRSPASPASTFPSPA